MTAGPGTSNNTSAAATKRAYVEASGISYTLRRLRFAGRFCGATADHGERQVSNGGDAESKEQTVVIEALDEGGVVEDTGEIRGGSRLDEAGDHGDHPDK